jgi:hypothetical protein
MTSWGTFANAEPVLAGLVRRTFAIRKHATLATLRSDGSPRLSGSEVEFDDEAGELLLGSMPGSRKSADLRRDPRLALHCPTEDPPPDDPAGWLGDGKVAGIAVELSDPSRVQEPARFRVELTEVVHTRVAPSGDHLLILSWHPGRGTSEVIRS